MNSPSSCTPNGAPPNPLAGDFSFERVEEACRILRALESVVGELTPDQARTLNQSNVLKLFGIVVLALRSGQLRGEITPAKFLELLQRASTPPR